MLLTGFDAPRLKKLYMGRVVKEHNLLQALTRVNRPYKNFRYGYIVDFADIRKEFEVTNASYSAELENEIGSEIENYSNLFLSRNEILATIYQIKSDLFDYDLQNAEEFSKQISAVQDKKVVRQIISSLEAGRNTYNLIRLMNFEDLANLLDFKRINLLLNETINHLYLLNLKDKVENTNETRMLLNSALEEVVFMFRKEGEEELRIGEIKGHIKQLRETLERNVDEKDPEYLLLIEELRRVLTKGKIYEANEQELEADIVNLTALIAKAKSLNLKNSTLATKYDGDVKYVRIHKTLSRNDLDINDIEILNFLLPIRGAIDEIIKSNQNILGNRGYFEALVDRSVALNLENIESLQNAINSETLKNLIASEYFKEYEGEVA
jgi:type I restriction enzyme R subunit